MNDRTKFFVIGIILGLVFAGVVLGGLLQSSNESLARTQDKLRESLDRSEELEGLLADAREESILASGSIEDGQRTLEEIAELAGIGRDSAEELIRILADGSDIIDGLLEWAETHGY